MYNAQSTDLILFSRPMFVYISNKSSYMAALNCVYKCHLLSPGKKNNWSDCIYSYI